MTADTYSAILGWLDQGTGNNNNAWGDNCDTAIFPVFERGIAGRLATATTGGAITLNTTTPPAGLTTAIDMIQEFTGTLASDATVTVPNLSKIWVVDNQCTLGSFALKFKTPSGSAVTVPAGMSIVKCDGSNGIKVGMSTSLRDTQWLGASGTVAAPGLSFAAEGGSGVYRKSAGVLGVAILGEEILEVSATAVNVVGASAALQQGGIQIIPAGAELMWAGIELPAGGWLWEEGTAYSRTTYANLFAAVTKTATATTSSGNNQLTSVSADLRKKGLVGAFIEGTGIPTGTTITAIAAATITLSANATGSGSGVAIRILPWGQGDGSTTFNVPDRRSRAMHGRADMNGTTDPGTITLADLTKLNVTFGAESLTIAQANLPNVNFTCSITITDPGHSHHPPNLGSPTNNGGGPAIAITGYASGTNASFNTSTDTTGITASGTAASGGSGTALNKLSPGAVTNFIIKT